MRHQPFCMRSVATLAVGVMLISGPVFASGPSEREQAFQAMLVNPTDPAAMMAFARAAAAERDYEAVAGTLERLLDLEPGHAEARFELAVAYYALGSYELAAFHFSLLQELDPNGARSALVDDYLARIEKRSAPSQLVGRIALGGAATDDGATGLLSASLRWDVDLGGANDTTWRTDLLARAYAGDEDLTSSGLRLRTGPAFSISGDAFGARLRPYAEFRWLKDPDGDELSSRSLGLQYLNTFNAAWSGFADVSFGSYSGSGDLGDGERWAASLGVTYRPSRDARLRFSLFGSERDADLATERSERFGARFEYRQAFTAPFGQGNRPWVGTAFAQYADVDFVNTDQEDTYTTVGVSLRAFVHHDLFVEAGAQAIRRDSSAAGLDETRPVFSLLIGREF